MIQDPVSDFIIRLKNASRAGEHTVLVPYTKLVESIAVLLLKKGYIEGHTKKTKKGSFPELSVTLKEEKDGKSVINEVKRISKLSKRVYTHARDLYPVRHGYGMAVISTSKGLMSGIDARKSGLGGEVLFEIW